MDRFRIYVPNYSDAEVNYTVKTTMNFINYDLYYLKGYADDYIDNLEVDSTQWYEWQWSGQQETIYAWKDGFLYPVFNSKESGVFHIEFIFGNINGAGLLDFQFLSWEHEKVKIGKPRFYMTASLTPQDTPVKAVLQEVWIYGGSSWCDVNGVETGDPTNYGFVNQKVKIIANGTIEKHNEYEEWFGLEYPQEVNLGLSVGFLKLDPRENDYVDIGIFFNLTSGNLYKSYYEGNETADPWEYPDNPVLFEPKTIEIWTPPAVAIETPALVYNETSEVSFISPQFKVVAPFASTATTGLLWYSFQTIVGGIFAGPFGVVTAAAGGFGVYQLFNFIGDQQIVKSYEDQGNLTYRKLHSDWFKVGGDIDIGLVPNNGTEALFIRLKSVQRYHCGSIKIKIKGTLGISYLVWLLDQGFGTYGYLPIEVETTFILPIFVRD